MLDEQSQQWNSVLPLREEMEAGEARPPRALLVRAVCAALEAFPPI